MEASESGARFESDAVSTLRRASALELLTATAIVAGSFLVLPGLLALPIAIGVTALGWVRHRQTPARRATICVDGSTLAIDVGGRVRESRLQSPPEAWTWNDADGVTVALLLRDGLASIHLRDTAQAGSLLSACRIDAGEQLVGMTLTAPRVQRRSSSPRTPRWRVAAVVIVSISAVIGLLVSPMFPALLWSWVAAWVAAVGLQLVAARVPARALVGRDGVVLRELGKRRFIAYDELVRVHRVPFGVALILSGGKSLVLPLAPRKKSRNPFRNRGFEAWTTDPLRVRARRDVLAERISTALDRFRDVQAHVRAAALGRDGRSFADWKRALTSLASHPYRDAQIGDADLVAILEDPRALPEHRIGAALALRHTERAELRVRIQSNIDSCANPALRSALDAASRDALDEATLERACGLQR